MKHLKLAKNQLTSIDGLEDMTNLISINADVTISLVCYVCVVLMHSVNRIIKLKFST